MSDRPTEAALIKREEKLRAWFTQDCDPIQKIVDGLDIGWAGVQRWATARISLPSEGPHLDIACGYATFLAQVGWRFPTAQLVGLNLDFEGPHALAQPLLARAGVTAMLVQADARRMPWADGTFGSASCFLGLQDIAIGFGQAGVRATLLEAGRVLHAGGLLILLDEFPFAQFDTLLEELPIRVIKRHERSLDVRWNRQVAERAIALYSAGWVAQMRLTGRAAQEQTRLAVHQQMATQMEHQLDRQGYYVPFGPVRMVVARKIR